MVTEPSDQATEEWREILTKGHRKMNTARAFFRVIPSHPRCKACNSPFGGIGGKILAPLGWRPSRKNPNFCERCCEHWPNGGAEVDLAVLFADVRGSTGLAESMSSTEYAALLDRFYGAASRVLLGHDAVIDKLIGRFHRPG